VNISQTGIDLIKGFEGYSDKVYLDTAGIYTIGYGSTKGITRHTPPITKEQGEKLLIADLADAESAVNRLVDVPLTQNQFDALVSFVFNLGAEAFRKSTLLQMINTGQHHKAPEQFQRWKYAGGKESKGIITRRLKESALYQTK
jgi:lysozyme